MNETQFVELTRQNVTNLHILERLPHLGLPDAWLVAGSLFQTVWNCLTGEPTAFGIKDYDIFYFDDSDLSWQAEDDIIQRADKLFGDLDVSIEVRNQARVHLWYGDKFGMAYPPLKSATEAIDRFLATACQVGVKPNAHRGGIIVYAPHRFDDLERMIIRPNLCPNFVPEVYRSKAARWKLLWPELTIVPYPD